MRNVDERLDFPILKFKSKVQARGKALALFHLDWSGFMPSALDPVLFSQNYAISVPLRSVIQRYSAMAVAEWTASEENKQILNLLRMPARAYADAAFALLADCEWDQEKDWFCRDGKADKAAMLQEKFWTCQPSLRAAKESAEKEKMLTKEKSAWEDVISAIAVLTATKSEEWVLAAPSDRPDVPEEFTREEEAGLVLFARESENGWYAWALVEKLKVKVVIERYDGVAPEELKPLFNENDKVILSFMRAAAEKPDIYAGQIFEDNDGQWLQIRSIGNGQVTCDGLVHMDADGLDVGEEFEKDVSIDDLMTYKQVSQRDQFPNFKTFPYVEKAKRTVQIVLAGDWEEIDKILPNEAKFCDKVWEDYKGTQVYFRDRNSKFIACCLIQRKKNEKFLKIKVINSMGKADNSIDWSGPLV